MRNPDRFDFLVLSPLPLRQMQMLAAKALALASFLVLFLVASGLFGALLLPVVSHESFWRQMFSQIAAVGLAGLFGALAFKHWL